VNLSRSELLFEPLRRGREQEAAEMIGRTFATFVADQYPPEGVREFMRYADSGALIQRAERPDYLTLIAVADDRVIGVVELREGRHISLMFVDEMHQRKGLGRMLLHRVISEGRNPAVTEITVNSSPNAAAAYCRMGFRAAGPQRQENGISYISMTLSVQDLRGRP
jgi:GNAT superfamily N-acetyltransferase